MKNSCVRIEQKKGAKAAAAEKKLSAAAGQQSSLSREMTLCTQLTLYKRYKF